MSKQLNDIILEKLSRLSPDEKDSLLVWLLRFHSVANGAFKNIWTAFEHTGELINRLVEKDQASADFTITLMEDVNAELQDETIDTEDEFFDGMFEGEEGESNEDD